MLLIIFLSLSIVCPLLLFLFCILRFGRHIHTIDQIKANKLVLVLGAGLEKNGQPSDILADRLITAHQMITRFSPEKVILSGSGRSEKLNDEPTAMKSFLLEEHVHPGLLVLDQKGHSTFHSLVNLSDSNPTALTTIVSQRFHLFRALMISELLGLHCNGVIADNLTFSAWKTTYWYLREVFAIPYNIGKIICYRLCNVITKS